MIGERRNCDPGLLLSIDFTKCDGEYFRSQDAYGNKVQMIGNLWRLDGAKLNGSSDYFVVPDRDNLSFGDGTNDKPFSISARVNMNDATNFVIASKGVYNTDGEYLIWIDEEDKIGFYLFDESVASCFVRRRYNSTMTAYEGQWIYLIVNYDGRGGANAYSGMSIYLNSVQVDDDTLIAGVYVAMENLDQDVWIGRYDTEYTEGKINVIKIWNRKRSCLEQRIEIEREQRK